MLLLLKSFIRGNRSLALGITTAADQLAIIAFCSYLVTSMPWSSVIEIFAIISLITILLVPLLKTETQINLKKSDEKLWNTLKDAVQDPTYIMLFFGFFSCGFQLAFITAHFPAFIAENSSPIIQGSIIALVCNSVESLGALSMALIGFFNIIGCLIAALGKARKNIVKSYKLCRTIASILFILQPPTSVAIFSIWVHYG